MDGTAEAREPKPLEPGREPCPHCAKGIRPGARKCPHCRRYLDPMLAGDRREMLAAQVAHQLDSEELHAAVRNTTVAAGIGAFVLFPLGPLFGPACLGYALVYQNRARRLQIAAPRWLNLCFGFAGLWFATGAIFWALFWYLTQM